MSCQFATLKAFTFITHLFPRNDNQNRDKDSFVDAKGNLDANRKGAFVRGSASPNRQLKPFLKKLTYSFQR